ncbi:hypothetical protein HFO33_35405 [Rhizobium leguminosarum]|uniref:hypothetical protein n=1 Tax=Rhizobium leguminosarum TaxID=384 RepID=UPI001C9865E2|nr:hypothetical protein [Rhizobium leguminosarum]MBY5721780.1 hypothetical protein [Rhizobium leguminosarum]
MANAKVKKTSRPQQTDNSPSLVQPIEYHELLAKLADPSVPESQLLPYIETDPRHRIGMAPALLPNENVTFRDAASINARVRGNAVLGSLNFAYRNRRLTLFNQRIAHHDHRPIVLAEGDSWFQYPMFVKDTIDYLVDDYNVYCMSGAGDELRKIAHDMEFVDLWRNLRDVQRLDIRALLISAGGNDIVGEEFSQVLRSFAAGQSARDSLDAPAWKRKLGELVTGYEKTLRAVRQLDPSVPILIHAYDYANPLPDQGLTIPPKDGWLGEPMRKRGYADGPLQAKIVKVLLEDVNIAFRNFENQFSGVHFVDNRGTVKGRWFDELHPNDAGFLDVAANFHKALRALGIK